jgi:hypothetical protein
LRWWNSKFADNETDETIIPLKPANQNSGYAWFSFFLPFFISLIDLPAPLSRKHLKLILHKQEDITSK